MKAKKVTPRHLTRFKDKYYGKRGTAKCEELEAGYGNFKIGTLLHEAKLEKGLTQEELLKRSVRPNLIFQKLRTM